AIVGDVGDVTSECQVVTALGGPGEMAGTNWIADGARSTHRFQYLLISEGERGGAECLIVPDAQSWHVGRMSTVGSDVARERIGAHQGEVGRTPQVENSCARSPAADRASLQDIFCVGTGVESGRIDSTG